MVYLAGNKDWGTSVSDYIRLKLCCCRCGRPPAIKTNCCWVALVLFHWEVRERLEISTVSFGVREFRTEAAKRRIGTWDVRPARTAAYIGGQAAIRSMFCGLCVGYLLPFCLHDCKSGWHFGPVLLFSIWAGVNRFFWLGSNVKLVKRVRSNVELHWCQLTPVLVRELRPWLTLMDRSGRLNRYRLSSKITKDLSISW